LVEGKKRQTRQSRRFQQGYGQGKKGSATHRKNKKKKKNNKKKKHQKERGGQKEENDSTFQRKKKLKDKRRAVLEERGRKSGEKAHVLKKIDRGPVSAKKSACF